MIDDQELRDLFKIESEEHLEKLDLGLLHLEKSPDDAARLDEVFREAHSLKGSSRMLGVDNVEQLAHILEDSLGRARRGDIQLTAELIDRLLYGVDQLRGLVEEAVGGPPANVDVVAVSDVLTGARPAPRRAASQSRSEQAAPVTADSPGGAPAASPAAPVAPAVSGASTPAPAASATPAPAPQPAASTSSAASDAPAGESEGAARAADQYRIETIRVHTDRLDALLTQAGELTVASQRIARRPEDIEELFAATEEWARSNRQVRRVMNDIYRGDKRGVVKRATIDRLREYLDEEQQRFERLAARMHALKLETGEDAAKIELIAARLEDGIRDARMVPMSAMFSLFSRTVRDLAREENKEVELVIEGGETRADKRIVEEMKDPLMHMLRNAVDHGVETPDERERAGKPRGATLRLAARSAGRNVLIEISDDGRGLDAAAILESARKKKLMPPEELAQLSRDQIHQLIFLPGFSTRSIITDVSGRGVGMDVVRANVERLKGSIQIETEPGRGSLFRLILPTALTTTRVLLIRAAGQMFAMPTDTVETTLLLPRKEVQAMEGRSVATIAGRLVPVARLASLLELPESAPETEREAERPLPALVITNEDRSLVLVVDELLDEQEIILKHAGGLLKRVRNMAGAAILESGSVCIVLNPRDLVQSEARRRGGDLRPAEAEAGAARAEKEKYTVLLAEDSITTRMQEKRILERAGYEVVTAVDGLEAYQKLTSSPGKIDALVSDVEMPNMDGFTLTARLRAHEEFRELPVVIVTTLASEEHRKRGMEAGANAYITKSGFNQGVLLETLRRLI